MKLTIFILSLYCTLNYNSFFGSAIKCYSCASSILRENWEVTGLPSYPTNDTFFTAKDCTNYEESGPKIECSQSCFFALYALITHDYVVVRGCVEDFIGDSGITPDAGPICEVSTSNQMVYVKTEIVPQPLVGWSICATDSCNNKQAGTALATSINNWEDGIMKCSAPRNKGSCISCQHFDGEGRCHHDSRSTCPGNYCTKNVGKLNGRWFEIRGCTSMAPMGVETCLSYKKNVVVEQLGTTINQTFHSTNCICKGDKCNSGMREILSISTLLLCVFFVFKLQL